MRRREDTVGFATTLFRFRPCPYGKDCLLGGQFALFFHF